MKQSKDDRLNDVVVPSRDALLHWYDRHRRHLPWRCAPGVTPDPYAVWLSEVMLQQTTVATVTPRFQRFLDRWPTVADLARAPLDDVLAEWAGLGYYARARNLHACARAVLADHGGKFPDQQAGLATLPGIGAYTSASIAAIAFDRPASVVDGNVERIVARLNAVEAPMPTVKSYLRQLAEPLFLGTDRQRPGDFAQAMMDLGATVCVPARPRCGVCPWREDCRGLAQGIAPELPRKAPKQAKPKRYGLHYWYVNDRGEVLMRRRPEQGLLGGMLELPGLDWQPLEKKPDFKALVRQAGPLPGQWRLLPGTVSHIFTHFHLTVQVAIPSFASPPVTVLPDTGDDWRWIDLDRLGDMALPTVSAKMVRHAMAECATMELGDKKTVDLFG